MIRLTFLLCTGLYAILLIAGQDKGQMRDGLTASAAMTAALSAQSQEPEQFTPLVKEPAPVRATGIASQTDKVVFVPAQPVRVPPVTPEPASTKPPEAKLPQRGNLAVVTARSANVRSGPSVANAVVGRLQSGEEVLVIGNAAAGWSEVRVEGDGMTGYIASRLLRLAKP